MTATVTSASCTLTKTRDVVSVLYYIHAEGQDQDESVDVGLEPGEASKCVTV